MLNNEQNNDIMQNFDIKQVLAAFAKKGYKTAHFADGAAAAAYLNEQIDGCTVSFGADYAGRDFF